MSKFIRDAAVTRWLLAAALLTALMAWPHPCMASEQRVALVIGNAAYPSSRLRNPVNDAKAMAGKLQALGFDVILKTDSSQRDMTRAFSQFGQKLALGSVGLFYYAGHGMQVQGKNFLIPVDAEIETEASVRTEAVDVDQLLHQLSPARLSMVILDACRNNPFERRFRSAGSGGLAQIDAPTGTLLAYATAPGKVASDGTGSNGLYTEALLKALDMPGLKVEDIFKQVRINVIKFSDGQQTPWESSSLTGEFYFTPEVKRAAAPVDDSRLRQAEKERAELAKALEDERKKRDKDAEQVRAEMEKLRAELQKIRVAAAAPDKPLQLAIAAPPPGPSSSAASPPSTPIAAPIPQPSTPAPAAEQLATTAPPPGTSATAATAWPQRMALLEKNRGQLTFAKAIALLFDISNTDNLIQMTLLEKRIQEAGWSNALAIGIDSRGRATWAGAGKFRNTNFAMEAALESCARILGTSCKVVFMNGSFQERNFMDWAQRLKEADLSQWRESFLSSIVAPPKEALTAGGGLQNIEQTNMARIFTPPLN